MRYKLEFVIIDYLQRIQISKGTGNRASDIGRISWAGKEIAGQNDIPVLLLSQLNRSLETRDDPMPMMADLRESGDIEQDADAIWFLHRPEYFENKKKYESGEVQLKYFDNNYVSIKNLALLRGAKNRNESAGWTLPFTYIKENNSFYEMTSRI